MNCKVENKKYYVKAINSSKANKMTALYHYSGVGFKKAIVNLGVFRHEDKKMVGVLQWGCSFQEGIRLDRYVKESITKDEYLELNRFSMADSEGKNSESQAISLGIKWIRKNLPNVKLLVSYAGRKEGNYGYIYQATNWEYLGYFVSEGFWFVDGEERHLATLWSRYSTHGNQDIGFTDGLKEMYEDVRKTWTKQFIYITRLDDSLTPAIEPLPYPKPLNEFPIKTREVIFKQNDDVFNNYKPRENNYVEYFDEGDELLFTRATLIRRGELTPKNARKVAMYDISGNLIKTFMNADEAVSKENKLSGIRTSLNSEKAYKDNYFRYYEDEPIESIEVEIVCIIDEIPFKTAAEAARYTGISRQAVSAARKRKAKTIGGFNVEWCS